MDISAAELSTIVGAIVSVLAVIVGLGTKAINMAKNSLNSKTNNAVLQSLISNVSDNATNIVKALNQTLVDGLKEKSSDGKLTKEEMVQIKNEALSTLMGTLSTESKKSLTDVFGNLESYLSNLIEAKVSDVKHDKV